MPLLPHARRSLLGLALVLTVAATSACGGSSSGDGDRGPTHVAITASNGSTATLADLKGTPIVVNMWATWCSPCKEEMPAFQQVATQLDGSVQIIGVNMGDAAHAAADFAKGLGVSYPQYTDPNGDLSTAFGVTGLPATAFVAADGTVLEVHQGTFTAESLRAAIAATFPTTGDTQP